MRFKWMDLRGLHIGDYFDEYSCDVVDNCGLLVAMCMPVEKKVSALLRGNVWSTEVYCQFWSLDLIPSPFTVDV